jgi:hypothetical protein
MSAWVELGELQAATIFTRRWLREYGVENSAEFLVAMETTSGNELLSVLSVADLALWVREMTPPAISVHAGTDECAEALLEMLRPRSQHDVLH